MPPDPFASTMENKKSSTKPTSAFNRELTVIAEAEQDCNVTF